MSKSLTIKAAILGSLFAATAFAAGDTAVEQRIAAMKIVSGEIRTLAGMAQGVTEYDDFAVFSALDVMRNAVAVAQPLFAEPTPEGQKTRAKAEIWADGSEFEQIMTTFLASIDTALDADPADLAAFRPLFVEIAKSCRTCHESYRVPEE